MLAAIPMIGGVIDAIFGGLDKITTTDEERGKIELAREAAKQAAANLQLEVNKTEAAHHSVFVAGWRPFIGWGLGLALILNALSPVVHWAALLVGVPPPPPVHLDAPTWEILAGILGLGALRTAEKVKGVARK